MIKEEPGVSGKRISPEEFNALREDEKGAIIQKTHNQIMVNLRDDGQIGRFVTEWLDRGVEPNDIALVYMGRWDYFTLPGLRASHADPAEEMIVQVMKRSALIQRCQDFEFNPDSPAGRYWAEKFPREKYPDFVFPEKGTRIYALVAADLRMQDLAENELSLVIFTHGHGSAFQISVTRKSDTVEQSASIEHLAAQ